MTFDFEKQHSTNTLTAKIRNRARVRHIQTQSYMQVGHYCGRLFCCVVLPMFTLSKQVAHAFV